MTWVTNIFLACFLFLSSRPPQIVVNDCSDLVTNDQGYLSLLDKVSGGDQLVIYGQVIDQATDEPIDDAELFFYQADEHGEYNSVLLGMPSFAKIRGSLHTGKNGCFKLETIVPGNYPDQQDGKHIHVIADAKGYEKWKFEFLFKGWINESTLAGIEINGDAIILDLKDKDRDQWIVEAVIALDRNQ